MKDFAQSLDKLAEVAVKVGLNLKEGQDLVMTASIEALPLARLITEQAYKAGARLVTTLYEDDADILARFKYGPDSSFDTSIDWLYGGMAQAYGQGAARLAISGSNPTLLKDQDPEKVSRANRARSKAYQPAREFITNFDINWTIVSYANPAWAQAVFPGDQDAVEKLWQAIFMASRIDQLDPIAAWKTHDQNLHARCNMLNQKRFSALHFRGPGTDLKIGLADDHNWSGGATAAKNGVVCNPNIPSEEVFTTPHKDRVEGYVTSTKPLSYQGSLIDQIWVRFEGGKIVEAKAAKGEEVLHTLLDTDSGARSIGEVALVPHSSPIAQSGILFYNTLYDENAASHIALGQAYSECITGGYKLSPEELEALGSNSSAIHVDWMIGSNQIDVDGIDASGKAQPLMRGGEWV
jgi:aminopeptidase